MNRLTNKLPRFTRNHMVEKRVSDKWFTILGGDYTPNATNYINLRETDIEEYNRLCSRWLIKLSPSSMDHMKFSIAVVLINEELFGEYNGGN